jgi:hypothetical protein
MLTVGVFKFKDSLATIFGGWGIIGTVLLVMMAATIPYGLCRGFGLSGTKAFFLTYILLYILSWFQFPKIYYTLSDKNLGLINLALLILIVVAIFKVVKFSKLSPSIAMDLSGTGALEPEIGREIEMQGKEQRLIKKHAGKITKLEIRTIDDIAELLAEIHKIIKNHRNNLPKEEREKITGILKDILEKEAIFTKGIQNLRKIFQRIGFADTGQLQEQKERMVKAEGRNRELLKKEIAEEEEKLKIEKSILELEERLNQYMNSFNELLSQAMEHLRASPYPFDSEPYLVRAKGVLKNIADTLIETKELEKKLIKFTRMEKELLKKEKKTG